MGGSQIWLSAGEELTVDELLKGIIMAGPTTVYCPKCGRKVGTYDGKSSSNLITRCKNCRKQIVYYIKTGEIKMKPLPPRTTSSGVVF